MKMHILKKIGLWLFLLFIYDISSATSMNILAMNRPSIKTTNFKDILFNMQSTISKSLGLKHSADLYVYPEYSLISGETLDKVFWQQIVGLPIISEKMHVDSCRTTIDVENFYCLSFVGKPIVINTPSRISSLNYKNTLFYIDPPIMNSISISNHHKGHLTPPELASPILHEGIPQGFNKTIKGDRLWFIICYDLLFYDTNKFALSDTNSNTIIVLTNWYDIHLMRIKFLIQGLSWTFKKNIILVDNNGMNDQHIGYSNGFPIRFMKLSYGTMFFIPDTIINSDQYTSLTNFDFRKLPPHKETKERKNIELNCDTYPCEKNMKEHIESTLICDIQMSIQVFHPVLLTLEIQVKINSISKRYQESCLLLVNSIDKPDRNTNTETIIKEYLPSDFKMIDMTLTNSKASLSLPISIMAGISEGDTTEDLSCKHTFQSKFISNNNVDNNNEYYTSKYQLICKYGFIQSVGMLNVY